MWSVLNDEGNKGDTIYIDHFISKDDNLKYYALSVWHDMKEYFKSSFPNTKRVRWNKAVLDKRRKRNVYIKDFN